jgi:hypothetical protein
MDYKDAIHSLATRRAAIHDGHNSSRPLSEGYEDVGMAGEFAFGHFCGLMPDIGERPDGDGGVDFVVPLLFTVDVKTARKAFNLIHEHGKPFADLFVLAEYFDGTRSASLVGWEYGKRLAAAPVRDFGYGVLNHYIPREELRPMDELAARLRR